MGIYLNPDNVNFQDAVNDEIYIDKSGLLECTNKKIRTSNKYICVSRPRRFGKSTAANMMVAYYSRGCDSKELFSDLKIAKSKSFEKHLNKYNVIHINMANYIAESNNIKEMLDFIAEDVAEEIELEMKDVILPKRKSLVKILQNVFNQTKIPFIFIIDEWDCIFREHKNDTDSQTAYLDFLRMLLKDQSYVALAYMTGILLIIAPIPLPKSLGLHLPKTPKIRGCRIRERRKIRIIKRSSIASTNSLNT